ncbi:LOW QUALITY PROTEIN: E3 SUMO-protein ligase ZBED1-like [Drosophila gunungcola]|uniref:LOW QUALITY PROTEIN: E3 SUMO-protein ligase ZBED1-like n=1 Tax=Drosophila gunungcola TaxID=103775 RepID=UPI0022E647CE|nr:LOW QUALITY PROTEIN: E3 SUMO-protein ligase ZBED1-like [Drosophila gunungcola]
MEKALKEQNNNVACQEEESDSTVPSKRKKYGKSSVWNFFNKSADGRTAKCIKCGKTYQTSGNTTNLSCHLKYIHPNLTISELPKIQQPSVLSFMEKKYEKSSNRKQQLDSALFYYITSDLRPFTVVENKGFRNFVNLLDPRYELPSRTTLRNVSMANAYEEKKARLYAFLQDVKHCAITSDCRTSRANECYVTVTCHFITADFELRNAVLSTEKLLDEKSHSSESIANSIRTVLEEWSLLGKVTAMVTDNAKNMIKACEILQIRHIPCFAHSINLTVQDCLASEKIKPILEKCKRIVTFFKSSTIAYAKFREAQECERPRWNSAYYMVERILNTKVAIASVLLNTPKGLRPLTSDEISILEDLKEILSPFEHATVHTSASTYVTVSSVIPVICGILHNLNSTKTKLQTKVGRDVCDDILQGVNTRLVPYENRTVTRMTTILDPRFKKEGFWNPFNSSQGVKSLEDELSRINAQSKASTSSPPTPESTAESNTLFSFLQTNNIQKIQTGRVDSILALRQYLNGTNLEPAQNPLDYWKISNDNAFKTCVFKYFCVPATSTDSERMFSKAGLIISEKRSSLKAKNVNMLLFLNKNDWIS